MFDHKLIAQLCALALMTFRLGAQTYTNDSWVYTLNESNEATIVGFKSSSGEVAIPSQIDGFSVTQVGSGTNAIWPLLPFTNIFNNPLGNIIETAVILPDTVRVIAVRAFSFSHAENNGSPGSVFLPSGTAPRHFIKALHIGTSVTNIGELAFESCSGLVSLTLPDSVSHVGANAFGGTGLTNVFIGAGITNVNDLTTFGTAPPPPTNFPPTIISTNISTNGFTFAPGIGAPGLSAPPLVNVDVSPSNPAFSSIDGVVFDKSATQIVLFPAARHRTFTIPDSVTYLAQDAFTGTGLTNIIIGAGITNIEHLFSLRGKAPLPLWSSEKPAPALKNINVSEANNAFSSIEGVLFDNTGNTLLIYPNARQGAYVVPTNVTNIADRAFEFCTGLTSVSIPDSVLGIGQNAFTGTGLTEILIGAGITNIDSFSSLCSDWLYPLPPIGPTPPALTDIHVSEENPMFASVGGVLFDKLGNELLIYPRGRQGHYVMPATVKSVRAKAFLWSAVSSVLMPNGVTNIGDYGFAGCSILTNAVIPDSVTSIGDNAFAWCWSLARIRLPRPFWNDYARLGLSTNVTIENASLSDFSTALSQSFAEGANSMTNQIEEARTAGKAEVTNNPAAFNLFTKEQFDNNRAAGQQDVLQNPMTYGLYDSNSIMDLRMGGLMIQRQGTNAVVSFQPQTTTDLTQPFTNNGAPITNEIPMPGNRGFLRIQAGPQPAATPALPGGFGGGG